MTQRLGLDMGSTTAKAVALDEKDNVAASRVVPAGIDAASVASELREALVPGGAEDLRVVATGYGRARVPFANRAVTEITCHARGVHHLNPEARTIVDVGGQDAKAIRLEADGSVRDFAMNDRCAAGTGAFLAAIAARFEKPLEYLSTVHECDPAPLEISSTCAVFAESEVVGLLAKGHPLDAILAGVHQAVAKRLAALLAQVGVEAPVVFSGGAAKNETLRRALERQLGLPVLRAESPQLTAALGAALLATS